MEKICAGCGSVNTVDTSEQLCSKCGVSLKASLEELGDSDIIAGTEFLLTAIISFILALINVILGPVFAFITIYSPMLPIWLFRLIPFHIYFYCALFVPIIATVCLVLNAVSRRMYRIELHTPKNHRLNLVSYRFSVLAVVLWMLIVGVGLAITFLF